MATVLQTISNAKIKVRYKEVYASEGINKKLAVVLPAGPYRGLGLGASGLAMNVTIEADPVALDHVAVYETSDGYSLTIRDTGGDTVVDLTALASNTVVIALYADYTLGADTAAEYRAYLYADYLVAPEKDELVVLGTVVVPASGVIAASAITPALRTMTWENKTLGNLSWEPLLRNPGFEMGETGAAYLHSSPYWQASMTGIGTFSIGPVDTDANSGDKSLEMVVAIGVMTAQVRQYLQVPVVTGQKIKLKFFKKVLVAATAATGTAAITLNFADKDGGSLSSASVSFDIESVDASWDETEGVVAVPTGVRVLESVTVDVVGTYPSAGSALRLDDIQVWLEPSASTAWLPGDARPTAEVATQALLVGAENSYDGDSVLVKYSGNVLRFRRRDADTTPANQYETTFPGDLSVGGSANLQGRLTLGQSLIGSAANADLARVTTPAGVSGSGVNYTLMSESVPAGEKGYRKFVSSTGSLAETVNASYDNGTNLWVKDVNDEEALRVTFSSTGILTESQTPLVNSWLDSAWSRPLIQNRGWDRAREGTGATPPPLTAYEDEDGNGRFIVDHLGLPVGAWYTFHENWMDSPDQATPPDRWTLVKPTGTFLQSLGSYLIGANIVMVRPVNGDDLYIATNRDLINPGASTFGDMLLVYETEAYITAPSSSQGCRLHFGLAHNVGPLQVPPVGDYVLFLKRDGDAGWYGEVGDGGTSTIVPLGMTPSANVRQHFRFEWHGANLPGGERVLFFINGQQRGEITTNFPTGAGSGVGPVVGITGTSASGSLQWNQGQITTMFTHRKSTVF